MGTEDNMMQSLWVWVFFCVGLIMQNFFRSNTYLCWMTFVLFAQVLKSVQKLKIKTKSE